MTIDFNVTQHGKDLDPSKYTWDDDTKTFSSSEDNLVLDFSDIDNCTFKTGDNCTFKTGYGCTFKTGSACTFDTGDNCTFKTGDNCTFKTGYSCTFDTGDNCTFKTGYGCVVVRRDIYELIELEENKKIKLNGYQIKGFTYLDEKEDINNDEIIEVNGKKYKLIK